MAKGIKINYPISTLITWKNKSKSNQNKKKEENNTDKGIYQ